MDLPMGHKYGAVALQVFPIEDDIPNEIEIGPGVWVTRMLPFGLPDHWKEWIGSLQADALKKCKLFIVCTGASRAPEILDSDNKALRDRAQGIFWGLVFSGHLASQGDPVMLTGASQDDGVDVRSLGRMRPPIYTPGAVQQPVDLARVRRAVALEAALSALFADAQQARIRRAVHAFYRGVAELDPREKLHQFLRVVEAFVNPETGKTLRRLRSRTELFLGPGHHPMVTAWFDARSAIEHLNEVDDVYNGTLRDRRIALFQNAVEVEGLARYCLARFLERDVLWKWYADDQKIEDSWALDADERQKVWGDRLNVPQLQAHFVAKYLSDETLGLGT